MKSAGLLLVVFVVVGFVAAFLWLDSQGDVTSDSGHATIADDPGNDQGSRSSAAIEPFEVDSKGEGESSKASSSAMAQSDEKPEPGEAAAAEESEGPKGGLRGMVMTPLGAPAADAAVYLSPNDRNDFGAMLLALGRDGELPDSVLQVKTDENGRYHFSKVPAAKTHVLTVDHPEFVRATLNDVSARAEEERELDPITLEPGGSVTGRVVDVDGRGVSTAQVTYQPVRSQMTIIGLSDSAVSIPPRSTETDDAGFFELRGIEPGTHRMSASAEDLLDGLSDPVALEANARVDNVTIELDTGVSITGQILSPKGQPVADAKVRINRRFDGGFSFDPDQSPTNIFRSRETMSDASGRFAFRALHPGTYDVTASAEGFATVREERVTAGEGPLVLELATPGRVIGIVTDATTGQPVTEFQAELAKESSGPRRRRSGDDSQKFEAKDGRFAIEDVEPGTYHLKVVSPRHASFQYGPFEVESGRATLEIPCPLAPASQLRGIVLSSEDGRPVAGAKVALRPVRQQQSGRQIRMGGTGSAEFVLAEINEGSPGSPFMVGAGETVTTDAEGRFAFERLDPDEYRLSVSAKQYCEHVQDLLQVVRGQQQDDLEIELDRAGSLVAWALASDGSTKAGLRIELTGPLSEGREKTTESTNADGEARFENLVPGEYRAQIGKSGNRGFTFTFAGGDQNTPLEGEPVQIVAGETTEIELEWEGVRLVRGRVIERGQPVQGATVTLKPKAQTFFFGGPSAKTDSRGEFLLENVNPGDYTISAAKSSMPVPVEQPLLVGEKLETVVEIVLATSAISGRVTDEDGDPVANARIMVRPKKEESSGPDRTETSTISYAVSSDDGGFFMSTGGGSQMVRTDANGEYRAENVPAGSYVVSAMRTGYITGESEVVQVKDEELVEGIDIELQPGGTISGRIVDSGTGDGISFASITIETLAKDGEAPSEARTTMSQNDGKFTQSGLAPGRYRLTVRQQNYIDSSQEVTLKDEGNVDVPFRLLRK